MNTLLLTLSMGLSFHLSTAIASQKIEGEEGAQQVIRGVEKLGLKPYRKSEALGESFYLFRAKRIHCVQSASRLPHKTRCTIESVSPKDNKWGAKSFHWTGRASDRLFIALRDFGATVDGAMGSAGIDVTDFKADWSERLSASFEDQNR